MTASSLSTLVVIICTSCSAMDASLYTVSTWISFTGFRFPGAPTASKPLCIDTALPQLSPGSRFSKSPSTSYSMLGPTPMTSDASNTPPDIVDLYLTL